MGTQIWFQETKPQIKSYADKSDTLLVKTKYFTETSTNEDIKFFKDKIYHQIHLFDALQHQTRHVPCTGKLALSVPCPSHIKALRAEKQKPPAEDTLSVRVYKWARLLPY